MNINEIKKQYPSLQKWSDTHAFELYKKIQEHQVITEFLSTVSPSKTLPQIIKQAGYGVTFPSNWENNPKNITLIFDTLDKNYLNKVNKVMDSFGWFPSYIGGYTTDSGKYSTSVDKYIGKHEVEVKYEAKYDQEIVPISKYAYHITPDIKWSRIKVIGLTPKTQGKLGDHPGRIYLTSNIEKDTLEELAYALWEASTNKDKINEMYLLQIDLSQLKNHKFFEDPNFFMGEAMWTYQNIPPSVINVIDKFKIWH